MMSNKERAEQLLAEAAQHTFAKNSYRVEHGTYSRPSPEMQAWIADVEDFISTNYGKDSAPWRVFERLEIRKLEGNYHDEFEKQKGVVSSALHACLRIQPQSSSRKLDADAILDVIFDRFHAVARRIRSRHASRETLDVKDEYDVQDLLAALLKLHFGDVRSEEWTPSYAGGSARMDFLLKEEKTVIEVKMTRKGLGDREIGNQLIEDVARYRVHPDCMRLICFVYDPDGRIQNPKGINNDLTSSERDFEVQIRIRPEA